MSEQTDFTRAHRWASRYIKRRYPELGDQCGNGGESGAAWWGAFEAYRAALKAARSKRRTDREDVTP
jgi:hypothetical protein